MARIYAELWSDLSKKGIQIGDHKTMRDFCPNSLVRSSSRPQVMTFAMQCCTQAGAMPFLVRGLQRMHNSVGNGRKHR